MSESEYKELVLSDYDRQIAAHLLPSELLLPTPANIKAEVMKICERGLHAADEKILRSFVGEKENAAAYRNAFSISKADPFRPLVNLLDDRSINSNIRNINLLALLIGFKSRPYHPGLQINGPIEQWANTAEPADHPVYANLPAKISSKKLAWVFAAVIVAFAGWYLISQKTAKHYTGHEGCMIWNDDHYEPIECNDRSAAQHYPIDHKLVDHFKRIKRQDTLTYKSIRKVWYSNYKGRMEFYTTNGPNPLDTNMRVLPMTTHILEKYVLHITN
jgi:hypothetical protein